jgi:Coenzyme PQQ synthesis protein D (PqqD)
MLHLESGIYYGLNDVGNSVWKMIPEPKRVGEILEALLQEYDVEREVCERDLMALLKDLAGAKLVEIRS